MSITLKQIAALAGVHKSTVDKVIHNRPGVSEARRQQIRRLLDEYGYESNPLAKALNYQKKKMKVAVVLPTVDAQPILKQGMELVRQDFNSFNVEVEYHEMPFSDAEGQARCLRALSTSDVSGVVLLPIESPAVIEAMQALQKANIPVVAVNSDLEDAPYLCFVGQDMEQAGRIAARMFDLCLPQGGTLGIVSSQNMRAVKQREHAFRAYLGENFPRISVVEAVDIHESSEEAYGQTIELLKRHPQLDALFITCGRVPDICRAVRDRGMLGSLTVLCYEKYPEITALMREGEVACTISGDLTEQGRLAMRLLFQHLIYEHKPEQKLFYTKNEILLKENITNQ